MPGIATRQAALIALGAVFVSVGAAQAGLLTLVGAPAISTVDAEATGFGTFQSHNQKVVRTGFGIFLTYVKTPFDLATWRLARSVDDGATFETIWEAQHATHPPALEAASDGTLYLAHGDGLSGASYVHRATPAEGFAVEPFATIDDGYAQKFSLLLDEPRGRLHYAAYLGPNTRLTTLDLGGAVVADILLTGGEAVSAPSYPRLVLSDGVLYVAWSTDRTVTDGQGLAATYYRSIHVVRSPDGGDSWENLAGVPLLPPFVADEEGTATEITHPWERSCRTWLTAFAVARGKGHFFYLAAPNDLEAGCPLAAPQSRYQRVDTTTGTREVDTKAFAPAGIALGNPGGHLINGFFAVSTKETRLWLTTQSADNRLMAFESDNQGDTWHLAARSQPLTDHLYAIGGPRQVTSKELIGSYTHDAAPGKGPPAVRFFRARLGR